MAAIWPPTMQNPATKIAMVTKTAEWPSWPIAPTANTADEIHQRQRAKREAVDDAAKRESPDHAADLQHRPDHAAAAETEAPRSLSTVGSQFDRK